MEIVDIKTFSHCSGARRPMVTTDQERSLVARYQTLLHTDFSLIQGRGG